MKVLITGSSRGIGLAVANHFLANGHEVIGFDLLPSSINHPNYTHYQLDVSKKKSLPNIEGIEIVFNNAGKQNDNDIQNNLVGSINITEKYAFQDKIKSVLFNASASARSGFEFPEYVASKAGVVGYMKNVATRLVVFGATVNSISLGGVLTDSNAPVMEDAKSWNQIMEATPLKKWMTLNEVCDWVYFLTVVNKSLTGQDILVDNGEYNLNSTFVWPKR
ncbi:MAG: SDR family oxidoreductase [Bacilli bacterium]|nr:SDR family oxidoreductase [Bacilli bacterium]